MGEEFTFRSVYRRFNDDLLAVNRDCPIEATFTIVFGRGPDFFRWPETVFDSFMYQGILCDGRLVGYLLIGFRLGWTGSRWETFFYVGDVRVLPEFRGQRLSTAAFDAMVAPASQQPPVPVGLFLVNRGNVAAERLVERRPSARHEVWRGGGYEAINIPLIRRVREPKGLRVRCGRAEDLDALEDLQRDAFRDRLFAPRVTADGLAATWRSVPGLAPEHYLVAERAGEIVGAVALWDMGAMRRTMVLRYPPKAQLLRGVYRLFTRFGRAAPLPKEGEAFRTLTATQLAVHDGDPEVARALFAAAINRNLVRGYHMIQVGLAEDDPLRAALDGLLVARYPSDIYLMALPEHAPEVASAAALPVCLDLAVV